MYTRMDQGMYDGRQSMHKLLDMLSGTLTGCSMVPLSTSYPLVPREKLATSAAGFDEMRIHHGARNLSSKQADMAAHPMLQPPIELLRQFMDMGGWYSRDNSFRAMTDVQFVAAMGPPGGGRTFVTDRYLRHYHILALSQVKGPACDFVPFPGCWQLQLISFIEYFYCCTCFCSPACTAVCRLPGDPACSV